MRFVQELVEIRGTHPATYRVSLSRCGSRSLDFSVFASPSMGETPDMLGSVFLSHGKACEDLIECLFLDAVVEA